jgi:dTDP-4-dehydrorhamnose 3,5-epimerase
MMAIQTTPLEGVYLVQGTPLVDARGRFERLFDRDQLAGILGARNIVQINHSLTEQVGAVRGLHFQYAPAAEMKLVRCLEGRVFDVAVDLRTDSNTFMAWHAVELAPDPPALFVLPEGVAHGFQVLQKRSVLLYLHTAAYQVEFEAGVAYDDPALGIHWPLPATQLSERDRGLPSAAEVLKGLP